MGCGHSTLFFSNIAFLDVVKMLFEAYPKATQPQDKDWCSPLRLAIRSDASLDAVKMLLEAYPEAKQLRDKDGDVPLHLAIRSHAIS